VVKSRVFLPARFSQPLATTVPPARVICIVLLDVSC